MLARARNDAMPVQAAADSAAASSRTANTAAERLPARRILVVDDNEDAATSLSTLLQLFGHHTRVAFNGLQALHEARDFRPDGVLLDIELPDVDGWEVARRLRATGWGVDCVLLALTGLNAARDHQRSRAAGFDGHLVKPVRPEVLVRQLAELLASGAWARRQARAGVTS